MYKGYKCALARRQWCKDVLARQRVVCKRDGAMCVSATARCASVRDIVLTQMALSGHHRFQINVVTIASTNQRKI